MNRSTIARHLIVLLFSGLAISCSKMEQNDPVPQVTNQTISDGNYRAEVIPLELARKVAENQAFQKLYLPIDSAKVTKSSRLALRTIKQAITFKDKHNQPAVHLMSYEQGGFAILSAERTYDAVLAIGDEATVNVDQMPETVREWLGQQQQGVEKLRMTKRSARLSSASHSVTWSNLLASTGLSKQAPSARICDDCPVEPDPTPCVSTGRTFFYPLVKTEWNQSGGGAISFNFYAPGGALAGCGPVAAAQIMHYYKYPTSFISRHPSWFPNQWATMYWQSTYLKESSTFTALLLACIGYSSNSNWGINATGTNIDNLAKAFKNDFGYKTAYVKIGPTMSDILLQVNNYRPVLMRGTRYSGGHEGHLWVCDGYMKTTSTCNAPFYWLHMNWGWGGDWNGYYSDSYSSPTSGTKFYDENGNQKHKPDHNPYHNGNSDVFAWNRKMIVVHPN